MSLKITHENELAAYGRAVFAAEIELVPAAGRALAFTAW
jgi:hypothetical protein